MNKITFTGRILEASYVPAAAGKKSRATVKIACSRKGAYDEIELTSFTPSAEFIGRGQGVIPMQNGEVLPENKKGFLPGCRVEGHGYVKSSEYPDKNGVKRKSYQFYVEEIASDPYDQEAASWLASYNSRKASTAGTAYAGYQQLMPQMQMPQMAQPMQMNQPIQPQMQMPQAQMQVAQPMQQQMAQPMQMGQPMQQAIPAQGGFRPGTMPQNMAGVPQGGFRPGYNPQQQANKPGGYVQMPTPQQG